jgi:hypothetical protein
MTERMEFREEHDHLVVSFDGMDLVRYVFLPDTPPYEAPSHTCTRCERSLVRSSRFSGRTTTCGTADSR